MRLLVIIVVIALPLSAQTFRVSNLSNQNLDELELFEQRDDTLKQIRDLHAAGAEGSYLFDVAAEVCLELRDQMGVDWPTRAKVIRADDHTARCSVDVPGEKARFMWDGWDWNEPAGGDGTTRTVCASGCDHTTVQAAVDAAVLGDLIELSVESFGGGATDTILSLPANHDFQGTCPTYTVIRTAGYASNFTRGVRVRDNTNMATLSGGASTSGRVIRLEAAGQTADINAVNTATDVLTSAAAHGFSVDDEVVWMFREKPPYTWIDGGDFFHARRYYVLTTPTTTTLTLSETPGGSTVDIITTPTNLNNAGLRKANRQVACWKLQGLEIEVTADEDGQQTLIFMRDGSPFTDTKISHIIFEHLYLHGHDNLDGPRRGLLISGSYVSIRDSLIEEITSTTKEAYGIVMRAAPGPIWIENNSISSTSMSFFASWNDVMPEYFNPGSKGGMILRNNYLWKKPDWYVRHIAGSPVGACHTGSQYKDTDGPTCYTCAAGTWPTPDANCDNFIDYVIKNTWESKACTGCLTENMWADLSPFGDGGQQSWLNIKVPSSVRYDWIGANDIIFKNFRTRYTAAGPSLRGIENFRVSPVGPIVLWNGISSYVDPILYQLETGKAASRSISFGTSDRGIEIRHFTQVGLPGTREIALNPIKISAKNPTARMEWLSIRDSIIYAGEFKASGTTYGCDSLNIALTSPYSPFSENNIFINPPGRGGPNSGTGVDHSACSTIYYSETSLSDIGFSDVANGDFRITGAGTKNDYRAGQAQDASDGKDIGVDFEMLNDGLGGGDPTAGLGSWSSQYGVAITAISLTSATVEFDRPASDSCDLTLYTNYARTAEHGDTNTAEEKVDTRVGNDVAYDHVTFNLGTHTALTKGTRFWFEISCPTDRVLMVGSLLTDFGGRVLRQRRIRLLAQ